MKTEIIIKDVTCPILTLTPSRMTIKFPEVFEDKDRIVNFSKQIEEKLRDVVSQSLRGHFSLDKGIYSIINISLFFINICKLNES